MLRPALLLMFALAVAFPLAATEKYPSVEIKEWPVPWPNSRPRDPHLVGTDSVWFVGQTGNYLATFNPQTARFSKVDLVDEPAPHSLAVAAGPHGLIWYTGSAHAYIGRYDPRSRTIARFPMPNDAATDPSAIAFEAGERNIWFTVEEGNIIGRLRLVNDVVDLIGVPTPHALPSDVAMAPNAGNPWFALFGTNKLATVDARTFQLTEYALPRTASRPRRIGFTSDGQLWYVDFAEGYLGAFTPATHAVKEWPLPGGKTSQPYALAVDSQDRIWCVQTGTQPNTLVGFEPKTEKFFGSTRVPSGGNVVRDMHYDGVTGEIWFATDANTIGYAKVN